MFEQASTEVHWLSERELALQLGQRPPWYEEFLIARCGLDKSAETRFYATAPAFKTNTGLAGHSQLRTKYLTRAEALKNFTASCSGSLSMRQSASDVNGSHLSCLHESATVLRPLLFSAVGLEEAGCAQDLYQTWRINEM